MFVHYYNKCLKISYIKLTDKPILTNTAPILTNTAPILMNTAPILTNTAPILTNTAPILTNTAPILTNKIHTNKEMCINTGCTIICVTARK